MYRHFLYHHCHQQALADQYAQTYMRILASLKKEGTLVYAPSIPFFENSLPKEQYQIIRIQIHQDF